MHVHSKLIIQLKGEYQDWNYQLFCLVFSHHSCTRYRELHLINAPRVRLDSYFIPHSPYFVAEIILSGSIL